MTVTAAGNSGVAGRINYAQWDKVATQLDQEAEAEEQSEIEANQAALGLNGKYARSQAEAAEREKAKQVEQLKERLESYKKREEGIMKTFTELLGPVNNDDEKKEESKSTELTVVRITQKELEAGKRVIALADTSGASQRDTIILTPDLSLVESKLPTNTLAKSFDDDVENDAPTPAAPQSIFGVIKLFVRNVHHCTIEINCKLISGTIEMHDCSHVTVVINTTVATLQADACQAVTLEYRQAPSSSGKPNEYWGDSPNDRVFHAGCTDLRVRVFRGGDDDDALKSELNCHYLKDGAVAVGNAAPEEFQFITSLVDGKLLTEKVVRNGATTGTNARAMTQRELEAEQARREKAVEMALQKAESMIRIKDKDGNVLAAKDVKTEVKQGDGLDPLIQAIVAECEQNKARGNEAFGTGEYGQAILCYSLALDKAAELPAGDAKDKETFKPLVPCDVLLSNRAACFLKLGQHEKAHADAEKALELNPQNIKALFRQGLALHAMGRYREAMPVLAQANKIEPKNKQVKQALQFCEVRLAQEERRRMGQR